MSERLGTAALLDEVEAVFRRYVVLQGDHFYCAVALWILHSHAIRAAETTPRLLFTSPEKESGKTRGLEVLELLVPGALPTMNATVAALFRLLAEPHLTTLLIDEADAIWSLKAAQAQHEDLRALLNAGYRRGAVVARVVGEGKKMTVKRFPVFAATALAAIGNVPETLWSRSIVLPMRRRSVDEPIESFRRRRAEEELGLLRADLERWAESFVPVLEDADPKMPDGLTDRAADIWEPLLTIADLAEGEWPGRARRAAVEIAAGRVVQDQSIGVRLLLDIRSILGGQERITSADLVERLNGLDESGWGGWHDGKGMTQRELAHRLKSFGIAPKQLRFDAATSKKGYAIDDFADAFARYLREGSETSETNRNGDSYSDDHFVSDVSLVSEEEEKPSETVDLALFGETATSETNELGPVSDVSDDLTPEQLDRLYLAELAELATEEVEA